MKILRLLRRLFARTCQMPHNDWNDLNKDRRYAYCSVVKTSKMYLRLKKRVAAEGTQHCNIDWHMLNSNSAFQTVKILFQYKNGNI